MTPDVVFAGEAEFGIPILDPNRQAMLVDAPFVPWGALPRRRLMRGTWHFYIDDRKFAAVWKTPGQLLATECRGVVEPNFSTHQQTPRAVALHDIYRKRWLACYWQSQGVRLLVDLNVEERFADLNLRGVPRGWSAFATRATDAALAILEAQHARAIERADGNPLTFVVYCGGALVRTYCAAHRLLYLPFWAGANSVG